MPRFPEEFAMKLMLQAVMIVGLLSLLLIGQDGWGTAAETPVTSDAQGPEGIWHAVSVEGGGAVQSKGLSIVITKRTVRMRVNNKVVAEAEYSLDLTRNPAEIDLKFQGHRTPGLYELKGDTLRICLGAESARPATFAVAEGAMLLVLKRPQYKLTRSPGVAHPKVSKALPGVAVAVLDDCDPDYTGDGPHGDGVGVLSREGKELFALTGLNNCETIGANHGIAIDGKRGRVFFRQLVANRVTALDFWGNMLFETDELHADSLAVDPSTGNVWCLTGRALGDGETVVLNERGELVATYAIDGFDIAHDPKTDTFWIVGKRITKVNRKGEVVFRKSPTGWAQVSVAVNRRDGSAWVAERRHPDVAQSASALLHLDAEGKELQRIDLAPADPFCVGCDAETGTAWVVDRRSAILKVRSGAMSPERISVAAVAIAIGSQTGEIWVTTENQVVHLDKQGKPLAKYAMRRPSKQSWIAVQ